MMNSEITHHRLIDLPEVKRCTGLSRSTIYNYIAAGLFPRSRKLGLRCVGWLETEINAWIAERPAA
jgi:prophage regulatory protein